MPVSYILDDLSFINIKQIDINSRTLQFILVFIFICLIIPYIYVWGANNKLPVL